MLWINQKKALGMQTLREEQLHHSQATIISLLRVPSKLLNGHEKKQKHREGQNTSFHSIMAIAVGVGVIFMVLRLPP